MEGIDAKSLIAFGGGGGGGQAVEQILLELEHCLRSNLQGNSGQSRRDKFDPDEWFDGPNSSTAGGSDLGSVCTYKFSLLKSWS